MLSIKRHWFALTLILCSHSVNGEEGALRFFAMGDLELASGEVLIDCQIGYRTLGAKSERGDNVLIMPTWFNGTTRHLIDYGHIGAGALLDTNEHFVIAIDSLGNGVSSSPSNSERQKGANFPSLTLLDMVRAQRALLAHLGIDHVKGVVGISMGGMQALQWLITYPDYLDSAVVIDGTPQMSAYGTLQFGNLKDTVRRLQKFGVGNKDIMRVVSDQTQLTLYTPDFFQATVGREGLDGHLREALDYYHSFDPDDYVAQIDAVTAFSLSDGTAESARRFADRVNARVMIVANVHDHMVHPAAARELADALDARYLRLDSPCGHLGSTCERADVVAAVHEFLSR